LSGKTRNIGNCQLLGKCQRTDLVWAMLGKDVLLAKTATE